MAKADLPWRRMLVEGLVIVLSILLAFAIDAMWELNQERSIEDEVLAGIRRDMMDNQAALAEFIAIVDAGADRFGVFIERTPEALGSMPEDSAAVYLVTLLTASTFQPVYGSLSDSNLTLVGNLDLRNELSVWLAILEDLQETAPYEIDSSFELMELAGDAGALLSAARLYGLEYEAGSAQSALRRLRRDDAFVNSALRGLTIRSIALQKLGRLRDSTDQILRLLEP